jgi:hypothetical protein
MRYAAVAFGIALTLAPAMVVAQPARIGRLVVLELPRAGVGKCRFESPDAALRRSGIATMLTFQVEDSTGSQLVSLGANTKGAPIMLMAMRGMSEGRRREMETVDAFFAVDGSILRGSRSALTGGTPARRSEDRRAALLPGDTVAIRRLITALRRRCRT